MKNQLGKYLNKTENIIQDGKKYQEFNEQMHSCCIVLVSTA